MTSGVKDVKVQTRVSSSLSQSGSRLSSASVNMGSGDRGHQTCSATRSRVRPTFGCAGAENDAASPWDSNLCSPQNHETKSE